MECEEVTITRLEAAIYILDTRGWYSRAVSWGSEEGGGSFPVESSRRLCKHPFLGLFFEFFFLLGVRE